jgi:S-formylglutathione hydrolase FrmB
LINGGKAREMIVVAPNANNRFGGSFYLNSPVTGNWEDYIFRDVVGYIDANYRTLARASSRGIAGSDMGGFGSVSLGMKHPDVFSAIYAMSPCCLGMEGEFLEPHPAWTRVLRITKEEFHKLPPTPDNVYTFIFVGLSAAFAPNPENKLFYSDFLYREEDGKLVRNEAVAAKWKAKMPLYMVDEYKSNLLSLRGIFLDYGQNEKFPHVRIATPLFSKALAERGIPHTFEIYAGGDHRNKIKERLETRVFRFFSERLDFSER